MRRTAVRLAVAVALRGSVRADAEVEGWRAKSGGNERTAANSVDGREERTLELSAARD